MLHSLGTRGLGVERFKNVTDGVSNTVMLGEMHTATQNRRRTFWAYTYTSYNQSTVCPECGNRTLLGDYNKCRAVGGVGGSNACKRGWGSFHKGGLHFAFGDGRVRFISQSIHMHTLGDLASIQGNEVIGEF